MKRERRKRKRERELKEWIYIAMKRKEWCAAGRRALSRIYIYILRECEIKVKANVWKQKEQWETKGNGRISHSSTYGKVVSQSHCCATPQEYEWAKNSPHFIIFFRLCVGEIKLEVESREKERREKREKEIKVAPRFLVYVSLDWKYLYSLVRKRNIHISGNYLHVKPHAVIEKFGGTFCSCFILNFYFSRKRELCTFFRAK